MKSPTHAQPARTAPIHHRATRYVNALNKVSCVADVGFRENRLVRKKTLTLLFSSAEQSVTPRHSTEVDPFSQCNICSRRAVECVGDHMSFEALAMQSLMPSYIVAIQALPVLSFSIFSQPLSHLLSQTLKAVVKHAWHIYPSIRLSPLQR